MSDAPTDRALAGIATRERCQVCHQIRGLGFHVPNEVWAAVVHPSLRDSILCLPCFADRADAKLIPWERGLTIYPVSLHMHLSDLGCLSDPAGWPSPT